MTEQTELLAGAVKKLQDAIRPLVYPQPHWDGYRMLEADPLYTRMRIALTAAATTNGAPIQASKPPGRIDVMAWFCDIDSTTAQYPGTGTTITKLQDLHEKVWTPDELRLVKAITSRCEHWTASAKELLGDNPAMVPLRQKCPRCEELWHYTGTGHERTRAFALRATGTTERCHVTCSACRTSWSTEAEIALLLRMLG